MAWNGLKWRIMEGDGEMNDNEIYSVFSRMLAYYLAINNMKQKELAERLGVSTSTVNDWCKGRKIARMSKVDKMCSIFGCRRSDLLEVRKSEEDILLSNYHSLNAEGKEKVREYINDLIDSGKYKKHSIDDLVEEA